MAIYSIIYTRKDGVIARGEKKYTKQYCIDLSSATFHITGNMIKVSVFDTITGEIVWEIQ